LEVLLVEEIWKLVHQSKNQIDLLILLKRKILHRRTLNKVYLPRPEVTKEQILITDSHFHLVEAKTTCQVQNSKRKQKKSMKKEKKEKTPNQIIKHLEPIPKAQIKKNQVPSLKNLLAVQRNKTKRKRMESSMQLIENNNT
jgi:hypothetical protein